MRNKFLLAISTAIVLATPVYAASLPAQEVASLRRLTQEEYRNSVADIFGPEIEVRGVFEPTCGGGFFPSRPTDESFGLKSTGCSRLSERVLTAQRSTPQVAPLPASGSAPVAGVVRVPWHQ